MIGLEVFVASKHTEVQRLVAKGGRCCVQIKYIKGGVDEFEVSSGSPDWDRVYSFGIGTIINVMPFID